MLISVVMIVQSNLATLPDCLASLGFADEIVVVDGGSTDGTLDYLRGFNGRVRLIEHPWPDHFGKQRQVSFDKAMCNEGRWWIRIDSDEIAPPIFQETIRRLLEALPPQITACRIKQYNLVQDWEHFSANLGGWETWPRVWRADRRLRWKGQVHEFVCKPNEEGELVPIPEGEIANLNLGIVHVGFLDREGLARKEAQYMAMPGSGFEQEGDLTEREYIIRRLPRCLALE